MSRDSTDYAAPFGDPNCDFDKVQAVDLAQSDFLINYAWTTGRLHPMILQFPNLKILRAEKLGIIVVDAWILRLKHLEEIFFAGNEITTWPQHLSMLKNLKILTLEGNPCLELQLRKSSSFRDSYFHLKSSNKHVISGDLVKGPEWSLAVQRRAMVNTIPGSFCGGVYRLAAGSVDQKEDFLTMIGPSRLDTRKTRPPPLLCAGDMESTQETVRQSQIEYGLEGCKERSALILELLSSIYAISGLYSPLKRCSPHYDALKPSELTPVVPDKYHFKTALIAFIAAEHKYTIHLQEVLQLFMSTNVPGPFVKEMSATFDYFPEIYLLHTREVLPILKKMYLGADRRHSLDISRFCERLLRLFKRNEFGCYSGYSRGYTTSQWRLWCSLNPDIQFDDEMSNISGRLGEWLYKEAMDSPVHSLEHAANYLDLPLQHLSRYCEFFNHLSRVLPECEPVRSQFNHLSQQVREVIEDSRRILRVHRLCEHYKLARERVLLLGYQWDALLKVSFRVYLEPGSHRDKTNDVLSSRDDGRMAMSVVSEVFSGSDRKIRLILCQNDLQIWDESVGKMIGAVDPRSVAVDHDQHQQLRVTFGSVDETITCSLVSFASVGIDGCEGEAAFIAALDRAQLANDVRTELNEQASLSSECSSTFTEIHKTATRQST